MQTQLSSQLQKDAVAMFLQSLRETPVGCDAPPCLYLEPRIDCTRNEWYFINKIIKEMSREMARLLTPWINWPARLEKLVQKLCRWLHDEFCRQRDICLEMAEKQISPDLRIEKYCDCFDPQGDRMREFARSYLLSIQDEVKRARERGEPYFTQPSPALIAAIVAATVILVGASLATLGAGAAIAPEVASMIIAAFPRRKHPDLETLIEGWAKAYLTEQLPLSGLAVGEEPAGLPITTPTVSELLDPIDVSQTIFDLHISELTEWAEQYMEEQAQIIGEA